MAIERSRQWLGGLAGVLCVAAVVSTGRAADLLSVTFFDVGYGDAILVRAPSGRSMLVDAGQAAVGPRLVAAIQALGVQRLDVVVATHPHPDHTGGLESVLGSIQAARLIATHPEVFQGVSGFTPDQFAAVRRGDTLDLGPDLRAEVLHPARLMPGCPNDNSVVLRLVHGRVSILLTGDIGPAGQRDLVSAYAGTRLRSTVVKVPHHGWGGHTKAFIEAVRARKAVISVGHHPDFPAPDPLVVKTYRAAGAAVHRTDQLGTITLESDGRTVRVRTERGPRP